MAISLHTAGSWGFAASGSVTPTLPTHSTGDMLIVRVAYKSSAIATCAASTATSGWAKVGEKVGTGNSGNGTGGVTVAAFWKQAASASETAPQIDFSQTVTQVGHVAMAYSKGAGESWSTPVGDGGEDTTADTSKSMTVGSHVSTTAGDLVDFFMGVRDDCTMTSPTFTQTGVTYAAVVESPATAGSDTSGADGAYDGGYRIASSGTSSAAAVVTGTLNTNETGSAWTTRLRVFTPEEHTGSFVATGGGIKATIGSKGGQSGITATGGGILTWDYTVATVENHDGSFVATGGGVSAFAETSAHNGPFSATGGGVVAAADTTDRNLELSATGGGAASVAQSTDRSSAVVATGGGTISTSVVAGRQLAAALSGGGIITLDQSTERFGSLAATGGGVAVIDGTQLESHAGSFAATAGGAATFAQTTDRSLALAATGAGVLTTSPTTTRLASIIASGGGAAALGSTSDRLAAVALTGAGILTFSATGPPGEPLPDPIHAVIAHFGYGGTITAIGPLGGAVSLDDIHATIIDKATGGEVG